MHVILVLLKHLNNRAGAIPDLVRNIKRTHQDFAGRKGIGDNHRLAPQVRANDAQRIANNVLARGILKAFDQTPILRFNTMPVGSYSCTRTSSIALESRSRIVNPVSGVNAV